MVLLEEPVCEENIKKQTCTGFGEQAQYCTEYVINGVTSKSQVAGVLAGHIPPIQFGPNGEVLEDVKIQSIKRTGEFCYVVSICWNDVSLAAFPKVPGQNVSFQFGIQTSTAKRAASYYTECYNSSGGTPNAQTFSNGTTISEATSDGGCKIVGCDVISPRKTYCETHCFSRQFVSKEYCRRLSLAVGAVNEFQFRDCDPCEMLMTSVSFSRPNTRSDWTANFCWAIAPNIMETYDLFLGFGAGNDPLTPADNTNPQFVPVTLNVGGWDHLQFDTHCYTDAFGVSQAVAEAIKLHRVYRKVNFNFIVPPSTARLRVFGGHPLAILANDRQIQTAL